MGGNALLIYNIHTKRSTTEEHEKISKELKPRIEKLFNTEVKFLKYFHKKESHGDLDILILNNGNIGNISNKLKEEFNIEHVNSNGGVYSFAYDNYQVDIIPQPLRNWETAPMFFDYDPTGNLMGKISKKFGLKYGFDGLVYPFRNFSGRLTKDIVISKNSERIFKFLGFDYERYQKGFETVEDIFEWVINSKYFSVDNFLMDNLTHIDRKRNAKRKTYRGFLQYVEKHKIKSNFIFDKNKDLYFKKIEEEFPEINFLNQLDEFKRKDNEIKEISERFNGVLIMKKFPHLKGKELGNAITKFKEHFENFNKYILEHSSEEIMNDFTQKLY